MFLTWWLENIIKPYMVFVDEWYGVLTIVVLVVSSLIIGFIYRSEGLYNINDYLFPAFVVTLSSVIGPSISVILLLLFPIFIGLACLATIGIGIIFAVKKIFWLKRVPYSWVKRRR